MQVMKAPDLSEDNDGVTDQHLGRVLRDLSRGSRI
jgi:hypothetical protein